MCDVNLSESAQEICDRHNEFTIRQERHFLWRYHRNGLQIAVLSNHQNGRDTHLRQVKVFGPRIDVTRSADQPFSFANPEFFGFSQVR